MKLGKRGKFEVDSLVAGGSFREDALQHELSAAEETRQAVEFLETVKGLELEIIDNPVSQKLVESVGKNRINAVLEKYKRRWAETVNLAQQMARADEKDMSRRFGPTAAKKAMSLSLSGVGGGREIKMGGADGGAAGLGGAEQEVVCAGVDGSETDAGAGPPFIPALENTSAGVLEESRPVAVKDVEADTTTSVAEAAAAAGEAQASELPSSRAEPQPPAAATEGGGSAPADEKGPDAAAHTVAPSSDHPDAPPAPTTEAREKKAAGAEASADELSRFERGKSSKSSESPETAKKYEHLSPSQRKKMLELEAAPLEEMKVGRPEFDSNEDNWRDQLQQDLQEYKDLLQDCDRMWRDRKEYVAKLKVELAPPYIPTLDELLLSEKTDWPVGTRFSADVVRGAVAAEADGTSGRGGAPASSPQHPLAPTNKSDHHGDREETAALELPLAEISNKNATATATSSRAKQIERLLLSGNTNSNSPTMRQEIADLNLRDDEEVDAGNLAKTLLARRARKNIPVNLLELEDCWSQTPIVEASKMGRKAIFDMLISAGAHVNYDDGSEHVTEQLFGLSALRTQFYHNSLGSSKGGRRLGDMQLSVDDWQQDQKYSQIFHKLEREIGILYGRGGESSNAAVFAEEKDAFTEVCGVLREADVDPEQMILHAPDITESIKLQAIREEELRQEELARQAEREAKKEALRRKREEQKRQIEEELEAGLREEAERAEAERLEKEAMEASAAKAASKSTAAGKRGAKAAAKKKK
eukprot:g9775.t1